MKPCCYKRLARIMGCICIPNQMLSLYNFSHSPPLAAPFFHPNHPLLGSSKHPLYSKACNTQPLSTLDFSLVLQDNHACRCMKSYTHIRQGLFIHSEIYVCVPYPLFNLVVASFFGLGVTVL